MSIPNQYEAREETRQQSHHNAVRSLAETRERLKGFLRGAETQGVPAYRCLVNDQLPTPNCQDGDYQDPREYVEPSWADYLRGSHTAAIEFWEEVRPFRSRMDSLWKEPLIEFPYPVEGPWREVDRGEIQAPYQVKGYQRKETNLALPHLKHWRFREIALIARQESDFGNKNVSRKERVYLPIVASSAIYSRLNDCLEEISLLAEVRESSESDVDPGRPDDLEEWVDEYNR